MSWLCRILRRRPEPIAFQGARITAHCWYCGKQITGAHTSVTKSGHVLRVHSDCRPAAASLAVRVEDQPDTFVTPLDYPPIG